MVEDQTSKGLYELKSRIISCVPLLTMSSLVLAALATVDCPESEALRRRHRNDCYRLNLIERNKMGHNQRKEIAVHVLPER